MSQPRTPRDPSAGRLAAALVATELAAGVGFYAVIAHLVLHLRHDLGMAASGVGVLLGTRTVVQYALYLPAGAFVDRLGAARGAVLACAVRCCGFAVLAVAVDVPALALAAVLIGAGGSGYLPAGQALLASLPGGWPRRGYAWYTAAR